MTTDYQKQAEDFLVKFGIKFRATMSDSKPANWEPAGHHYRVTLSRSAREEVRTYRGEDGAMKVGPFQYQAARLTFDFWGSKSDMDNKRTELSAYDVLACISGDVHTPDTFEDFCSEYGYETDSIKALQTFKRADRFAKRLREFFTTEEIEALEEIR